jgi:hypothetical protein
MKMAHHERYHCLFNLSIKEETFSPNKWLGFIGRQLINKIQILFHNEQCKTLSQASKESGLKAYKELNTWACHRTKMCQSRFGV